MNNKCTQSFYFLRYMIEPSPVIFRQLQVMFKENMARVSIQLSIGDA